MLFGLGNILAQFIGKNRVTLLIESGSRTELIYIPQHDIRQTEAPKSRKTRPNPTAEEPSRLRRFPVIFEGCAFFNRDDPRRIVMSKRFVFYEVVNGFNALRKLVALFCLLNMRNRS